MLIREKAQERAVRAMADYISRDDVRRFISNAYSDKLFATGYDYAILSDKIEELPAADVQPTEKVEEYRSLLKECERKLSYLLECEIESTWVSQKVKELIAKIQSCIQNNYGGADYDYSKCK